jgi:hypothetical protein
VSDAVKKLTPEERAILRWYQMPGTPRVLEGPMFNRYMAGLISKRYLAIHTSSPMTLITTYVGQQALDSHHHDWRDMS